MTETPINIQLALISHTNSGKTTLARTLIGVDVGEVRDAAHVTLLAEAHTLLTSSVGDALLLWDTPGFGDSVRLLKRLGMSENPIGWFLREVLDRYRDRSFWLSQQALRAAKNSADIVLYLINASENPNDLGYLPAEMKILEWLGKPVVVLLNQIGRPSSTPESHPELIRWKKHLDQFPIVRDVLALDAFSRCWVHERVFYEAIGTLIPTSEADGYARLLSSWEALNVERFHEAMQMLSKQLVAAARDREPLATETTSTLNTALKFVGLNKGADRRRQDKAMNTLIERLNVSIAQTTGRLLALHKLDARESAKINASVVENFAIRAPIDKAQAGLLGAVISGAATGVSADLLSGGLTFGAGALLGSIVGALTFAGAAWGFNTSTDRHQTTLNFKDDFLYSLLVASLLRYLSVIHFGRGRGGFVEDDSPALWQNIVEQAIGLEDTEIDKLWQELRDTTNAENAAALVAPLLSSIVSRTLSLLYPGTAARSGISNEQNSTPFRSLKP